MGTVSRDGVEPWAGKVAEGRMNDLQVASFSFILSVEKKMMTRNRVQLIEEENTGVATRHGMI